MSGNTDLAEAARLVVGVDVVVQTWRALRQYGDQRCEGLVLWLGGVGGREVRVTEALVPPQVPLRDEDGVGYFVPGEVLARLNRELYSRRIRLLAQVHSHPGAAYHSTTDDKFAIVTEEGGFSIVVPSFASLPPFEDSAVFRLQRGIWCDQSDCAEIITVR